MDEYCSILLAVPYNSVRRDMIDNVLVHAVRKTASEAGLTVEQNIDDPTLRDHIHDFYRSHVQTALHRLKALRDRGANDKNVSTLDSFCASTTTSRCMGNDHHPAASSSTAKEPGATVQQGGNSSLDETPRHDCVTCRIIAPAGIAATTAPMRRETSSSESFPAQVGTSFRDQGREPSSLSDPASTFVPAVQESQGPEQETIPVMTEGFIWRDFPACERVLHNYTDRYNEIAASPNNSTLLIIFTNVLVHAVRKAARDSGAAMDPEWDDGMLREHIHMFYKEKSSSSPQNARRRQSKVTVTATSILEDHVGSDRAVRHLA
jgi:hypothetical protein